MAERQDLGFANAVNMMAKAAHSVLPFTETLGSKTASTTYTGYLSMHPILNSTKSRIGVTGDTSLSDASGVFLEEVADTADIAVDGDYFLNHTTGYYRVLAGTTAAPILTYYVEVTVVSADTLLSSSTIIAESSLTITTAGTPVACPSNVGAKAVTVINNNIDGTIMAVGLAATVDAVSTPPIGHVLTAYSSVTIPVKDNSNEIYVDTSSSGKKVTVQILG